MLEIIIHTTIRTFAAVIVGVLIGSERARHGRAAGMRTHILVCLGACMTAMTSVYISRFIGDTGDISRIPAQVISGIGFLGAGMIILKNNNVITGLTTAAGVWTTATIGIALGYGFYYGAAIVTFLFLVTIILLGKFERRGKVEEVVYIELDDVHSVNAVLEYLEGILPRKFSHQVIPPKSNCQGNVGINLFFNKNISFDVSLLSNYEHIAFSVKD